MTKVSMRDMMTKFKASVQPHLDKGEEVMVLDGKTGKVRCKISPPFARMNLKIDWKAHWVAQNRQPLILHSTDNDLMALALNNSKREGHQFL